MLKKVKDYKLIIKFVLISIFALTIGFFVKFLIIKVLFLLGYKFKVPTEEQYKLGEAYANSMLHFPKEGAIKEYKEFIVINL